MYVCVLVDVHTEVVAELLGQIVSVCNVNKRFASGGQTVWCD